MHRRLVHRLTPPLWWQYVFTTYTHFLATIVQTDTLPNYRRSIAATMVRGVSFSIELKTNVH